MSRWPYVVVAVIPVLLGWPFVLGAQMVYWGVPIVQFAPWRSLFLQAWRAGEWPLWSSMLGLGAPLLANYQLAAFYPPNWVLLFLPLDYGHNLLMVAHWVWAGVGMVKLTRQLGFAPLGQTVSGLAFGLSQYVISRAWFYSINVTVAWLPWVIWAVEGVWRARHNPRALFRAGLMLAVIAAMQLLGGHAQTAWYTALLAGVWWLWRVIHGWERAAATRTALTLAGAAALAAGLAAVQLAPTAELLRQSPRANAANYDFVMQYSYSPWSALTWLAPDMLGNPARGEYFGYAAYWEDATYLGLIPTALALGAALGALWPRAEHRRARLAAGLALAVTVTLALGKNTPVFPWLYFNAPTFAMFQAPARMMLWWVFTLAVLGGWAVDRWLAPQGRVVYWSRLGLAGALGGAGLGLGVALAVPASLPNAEALRTVAWACVALGLNLAALAALTLTRPTPITPRWQTAVVAVLALDLLWANAGLIPPGPADTYTRIPPVVPAVTAGLQTVPGGARLYSFPPDTQTLTYTPFTFKRFLPADQVLHVRDDLAPNVSALFGVPTANNFDPLVSARYAEYMRVLSDTRRVDLLNYANIGIIHSARPFIWEVVARGPTATFYRVPGTPQPAWLATEAQPAGNLAEASAALRAPTFNPARQVILENAPALPAEAPATLAGLTLTRTANTLTAHFTATGAGWLTIADLYYPGWQAELNGQPTPIYPANAALRAVRVPAAGTHTLTMRYAPASVGLGALLSAVSGLALALGVIQLRFFSPKTQPTP